MQTQALTIGMIAAGILSWTVNHSIALAILHSLCSWIYIIWYLMNYL